MQYCTDLCTTLNMLTLKKSNYLDGLKKAIPRPKGATPSFGLPKWKTLPLESKIPRIPGLKENVYVLSRRKLGENLRVQFIDKKRFDTSDPYNYYAPLPYEGLHDPHLTRFFAHSPNICEFLIKSGHMTKQLDIKCDLKEYNLYRNYLRFMHGKYIRKELERRDEIQREKRMLEFAESQASKTVEKLKKEEILEQNQDKLEQAKRQKLQNLLHKLERDEARVDELYETKKHMVQRKKVASRLKRDYMRHKRTLISEREEQKLLNTLKNWHERDYRARKAREEKAIKQFNEKMMDSMNKFEKKTKAQEEAIEQESFSKECAEKFKKSFIEEYERRIAESRKKLHELFVEKRKALEKSLKLRKKRVKKRIACRCKRN